MTRHLLPLLLLAVSPPILFAGDAWTAERVTVTFTGETTPGAATRVRPVPLGGAPRRWVLPFPVTPDRLVPLVVVEDAAGGLRGQEQAGLTAVLDPGPREAWSLEVAPPRPTAGGGQAAAGRLLAGARGPDGALAVSGQRTFVVSFEGPRPGLGAAPGAPGSLDRALADRVPAALALVPGEGAPEDEVRAAFAARRDDELTLVFWNVGKGEHRGEGAPVALPRGAPADALSANVRALAARLRPDLLVLAEVTEAHDGRPATLDPETQAVLNAVYPGRLSVPSIFEFPRDNTLAIFSRFALVHVAGEERAARPGGGFEDRPWSLPAAPAPGPGLATVRSRWLDWTPPELAADPAREAEFRRQWTRRSDWHTRAAVRVDLSLAGQPVAVFPLHLAMPWLEVEPAAVRDGFLVDGVQDFQLRRRGPLDFQVARLREDLAGVGHPRVLLLGDTNIAARPRPNFPPLRLDPAAPGDGRPLRDRALAFDALADGLEDAFEGDREAWSWPSPASGDPRVHALARNLIDNVLHGAGLEVRYRAVLFPRGADHGALAVKVRLRRPGAPAFRPATPPRTPPLGLDVEAPALEVTAPARGALVAPSPAGTVEVVGRVLDPSGVAALTIDDAPVAVAPDGSFRHALAVGREGLTLFGLTATDGAGNVARGWRAVVVGRPRPAGPVEDAVAVRLGRPALDGAARLASARLGAVDLEAALRAHSPLYAAHLAKGTSSLDVRVEARAASTGAPTVALTPEAGGLRARVTVPDVAVTLALEGTPRVWGWSPRRPVTIAGRVAARQAVVEAVARPTLVGGRVVTRLEGARVTFDGFTVDARLLPDFARPAVARALEDRVAALLARQVERRVPPALDAALAAALAPREVAVRGRPLVVRLAPAALALDADGLTARFAADVDLAPGTAARGDAGAHPGSLGTPGGAPGALAPGAAFAASLDDDLLARAGHALWRAGALDLVVSRATAAGLGFPAWAGQLDAGWVGALLPGVADGLPPDTPVELELSPRAPPLLRPLAGGALELGLGDLEVAVVAAPPGGARRTLLRASASALVPCAATLDADGRLSLALASDPTVRVDVFEGALAARRQAGLEAILELAAPRALGALAGRLSGLPLPLPEGLRPADGAWATDGDRLTVRAALR